MKEAYIQRVKNLYLCPVQKYLPYWMKMIN